MYDIRGIRLYVPSACEMDGTIRVLHCTRIGAPTSRPLLSNREGVKIIAFQSPKLITFCARPQGVHPNSSEAQEAQEIQYILLQLLEF